MYKLLLAEFAVLTVVVWVCVSGDDYSNYPDRVCIFGDANGDFETSKDPRSFWGTYVSVDLSSSCYSNSFDCDAPIYKHTWWNTSASSSEQYLVKHVSYGWLITNQAPISSGVGVYTSCFKNDLFLCNYTTWYWGYLTSSNPLTEMRVKATSCQTSFCIDSLTIDFSGTVVDFSGTYELNNETSSYENGRYIFERVGSSLHKWYWDYKYSSASGLWYSNWFLGQFAASIIDLAACGSGAAESPLFCGSFTWGGTVTVNYSSYLGDCGPTMAPTKEPTPQPVPIPTPLPTFSPTGAPSQPPTAAPTNSPTAAPTPTPRCAKDYIFPSIDEYTSMTIDCPFGWIGTNVSRYCKEDGFWEIVTNDCQLISFTDRFTYWRDELWQYTTGYEEEYIDTNDRTYTISGDTNVTYLETFMGFNLPMRINFIGEIGSQCGGLYFDLLNQGNLSNADYTSDITFTIDCQYKSVEYDTSDLLSSSSFGPGDSINGTILYKENGYVYFYDSINGAQIYSDVSAFWNDVLRIGVVNEDTLPVRRRMKNGDRSLLQTGYYVIFDEISLTSWIDDFNTTDTLNGIWTDSSNVEWSTTAISSYITDKIVLSNSYQLYIGGNGYIESDSSQFQFTQPLLLQASILNTTDATLDFGIEFVLSSVATLEDIVEAEGYGMDNVSYNNVTITVGINDTTVNIISGSNVFGVGSIDVSHSCDFSLYEVFVTIYVGHMNVSVNLYELTDEQTYNECGNDILLDLGTTKNSLQNTNDKWSNFKLQSGSLNRGFTINYIDCTSEIKEDIVTEAPTASPTPAPSESPTPMPIYTTTTAPCFGIDEWPFSAGGEYVQGNATCKFGFVGDGLIRFCKYIGEWDDIIDDCSKISIVDSFYNSSSLTSQWYPWSVSHNNISESFNVTQSSNLLFDTSNYELTPSFDNQSVSFVRSQALISYPFKLSATMRNVSGECNNWAISIGEGFKRYANYSVRIDWDCDTGEMGISNSSFRRRKTDCWDENDDSSISISVIFIDNVTTVTDDVGCGSQSVRPIEILTSGQDFQGYLWLGTYLTDESTSEKNNTIARFSNIEYTQYFTTFSLNGNTRDELWDSSILDKIRIVNSNGNTYLFLYDSETVTSSQDGSGYFEFNIPFKMKIGFVRPKNNGYMNETGVWAHWIALGTSGEYLDVDDGDSTDGKMMLLYDGERTHTRQLITGASDGIQWYDNSSVCSGLSEDSSNNNDNLWDEINVEIIIDIESIYVSDDNFCDEMIVAKHDLDSKQTSVSLGIIPNLNNRGGAIAFSYFEVYQLATYKSDYYDGTPSPTYSNNPEPENTDIEIDDNTDDDDSLISQLESIFGDLLFVVVVAIALLIFCVGYCLLACCCSWWPYNKNKNKNKNNNKEKQNNNRGQLDDRLTSESNVLQHGVAGAASTSQIDPGASDGDMQTIEMQQNVKPRSPSTDDAHRKLLAEQQAQNEALKKQQQDMMNQMNQQVMMNQMLMQQMNTMHSMNAMNSPMSQHMNPHAMQQMYMQSNSSVMDGEMGEFEGTGNNPLLSPNNNNNSMLPPQPQMNMVPANSYSASPRGNSGIVMPPQAAFGGSNHNLHVQQQPQQQQQQQQAMIPQHNQDILNPFIEKVAIKQIFSMISPGNDGEKRISPNEAKLMLSKYRQVAMAQVSDYDAAIKHLTGQTLSGLRSLLSNCPPYVFADLNQLERPPQQRQQQMVYSNDNNNINNSRDMDDENDDMYGSGLASAGGLAASSSSSGLSLNDTIDFLDEFLQEVNLKQLFSKLKEDTGNSDPRLDLMHSKIIIANLRNAAFGMIPENDSGVRLITGMTMNELRNMLQALTMRQLRDLDMKTFIAKGGMSAVNGNDNGGGSGLALGDDSSQKLKLPFIRLAYNGGIQVYKPMKFGCFEDLCRFVEKEYRLSKGGYSLMYKDDDGDEIRVTSNTDIQESIRLTMESGKKGLKINVVASFRD